ncbi:MAG: PhzF family phenazine biosynthesis protein [Thermoleophilia bacterium]|nr:PhzF family phenazine biosynthesis protein [Thermoleophilia bacterium]
MQAFTRWTNLSEATFVLPPTRSEADYRLRIFTLTGELPFAGHPTLGSCHAWLEAGGLPENPQLIVQECGAGLVRIRRSDTGLLSFASPPLVRSGPVDAALKLEILAELGVSVADVVDMAWIDNGPGWLGVLLHDPAKSADRAGPDVLAERRAGGVTVPSIHV